MRALVFRWLAPALLVLCAVAMAASGPGALGWLWTMFLLFLAVAFSPLAFPRSRGYDEGRRRAAEGGVPLVCWKPGCSWCVRMRAALVGAPVVWVDVTTDEDAAAWVAAHNGGNVTTPTVWFPDGSVLTNPPPAQVRAAVRS
ncbi:glutaredoxin domain-containing protein [Nocardioides acrostichi]|uniref:Glutaredoxin domain-containing protein n=1 Tax=Nocardioides acrostichi TaxID=2784339 RepID=A0A930UWE8_9ACTN|nr:glutaredoxin domain-containing protein [Nocardioides acrostichi]MBF4162108.1 hypothetical protein [Nocardioides acrostichi]